jgi:hypothetical protein
VALAREDAKASLSASGAVSHQQVFDRRDPRRVALEPFEKDVERRSTPFYLELDVSCSIQDVSAHADFLRETANEGSKTDALHESADHDMEPGPTLAVYGVRRDAHEHVSEFGA